jgi:hypothetical protein
MPKIIIKSRMGHKIHRPLSYANAENYRKAKFGRIRLVGHVAYTGK